MKAQWKCYQEEGAAFFRSLGLQAEVEQTIEGARASHAVDVFVSGRMHGIDLRWVIECKAWKTNVEQIIDDELELTI
jgi:restriction system protein